MPKHTGARNWFTINTRNTNVARKTTTSIGEKSSLSFILLQLIRVMVCRCALAGAIGSRGAVDRKHWNSYGLNLGDFLCGVCIFSPLHASAGFLSHSTFLPQSKHTPVKLTTHYKLPVGVSVWIHSCSSCLLRWMGDLSRGYPVSNLTLHIGTSFSQLRRYLGRYEKSRNGC